MSAGVGLRFVLLQARLPGDRVRGEERACFARKLGVDLDAVVTVDLLEDTLGPHLLEDCDAILVGGAGDFSVVDPSPAIRRFIDFVGETGDAGFPMFASCFGLQALVVALGGTVEHAEEHAEVGSFDLELTTTGQEDPLFGSLPPRFVAQLGHKDRALSAPSGSVLLAGSERAPVQALRLVDRPVYATQFHPELDVEDNRMRFGRYMRQYGVVFGDTEAQRMLAEEFRPSPEASTLLRRFCVALAAGELT